MNFFTMNHRNSLLDANIKGKSQAIFYYGEPFVNHGTIKAQHEFELRINVENVKQINKKLLEHAKREISLRNIVPKVMHSAFFPPVIFHAFRLLSFGGRFSFS